MLRLRDNYFLIDYIWIGHTAEVRTRLLGLDTPLRPRPKMRVKPLTSGHTFEVRTRLWSQQDMPLRLGHASEIRARLWDQDSFSASWLLSQTLLIYYYTVYIWYICVNLYNPPPPPPPPFSHTPFVYPTMNNLLLIVALKRFHIWFIQQQFTSAYMYIHVIDMSIHVNDMYCIYMNIQHTL